MKWVSIGLLRIYRFTSNKICYTYLRAMKLSTYLSISASLYLFFGVSFLFFTEFALESFGTPVTSEAVSYARMFGTLLIGLAAINWSVRHDHISKSLRAILWANLFIQLISTMLNLSDIRLGIVNAYAWVAQLVHILLSIGFAYFIFKKH
jgi:hypothetical protein